MPVISETAVRELAGFTASAAPVTSLYLDVDGRKYLRARDVEPHLDALLREARARLGSGHGWSKAATASVEADLARIADYVRGWRHRSHVRGLALFSCTAEGLWRVVELSSPVRNRVVLNHTPYVRELEAVVARHERFAVLLADRRRARLFQFELGELVEKTELLDELPRHEDDGGGLNRDQVAGHVAAATHRHLRRAAQVAFDVFQQQGFDQLVLGAPSEVAGALERELHPYLRERIAARLSLPVGASEEEVCQAALEVEADIERAREAVLVGRLRDALGTRRGAVAGLEPVLAALVARRVDTLLVSEGFEAPGWRCRSCAFVGPRGPTCPVCAMPMDRVDDVVEEAVEEALVQSCRVAICDGNADLDVLGRIGALLRY
jgi:peptide chain release factor subunit 1